MGFDGAVAALWSVAPVNDQPLTLGCKGAIHLVASECLGIVSDANLLARPVPTWVALIAGFGGCLLGLVCATVVAVFIFIGCGLRLSTGPRSFSFDERGYGTGSGGEKAARGGQVSARGVRRGGGTLE